MGCCKANHAVKRLLCSGGLTIASRAPAALHTSRQCECRTPT